MSRDAAMLFGARLVSAGTTLFLLMYIGQTRGGEALGVAALGLATGALLSAVTDAGTGTLLIREGARDERQLGRLLTAMSLWRLIVIPIAGGMLWLVVSAISVPQADAVFLLAMGLAMQQFAELTRAVFVARRAMHISSAHSVVENVCWLLTTIGLLAAGSSLEFAFAAGATVFVTSIVSGFLLTARLGGVSFEMPTLWVVRRLVRQMGPFAAFMIVGVAYARADTLLVGALAPTDAVVAAGAYFAAIRLLAGLEYLPEAVSRATYPRLATTFKAGSDELARELRPALNFLAMVAAPIPVLTLLLGPWLMVTLFGADVSPYSWLVVPLGAVVPLRFLSFLFGMTLTSTDAHGRRVVAASVALGLVLLLDVILIPRIGIAGAVIGSTMGSLAVFAVYVAEVDRVVGHPALFRLVARLLALGTALFVIGYLVRPVIGEGMTVLIVIAPYLAAIWVTRGRSASSGRPDPPPERPP